jgi:dihydroorotate dehydrogenase
MAGVKRYTAQASKEDRWWLVRVDGVGVTQAKNLREARVMAIDLIETVTGLSQSRFELALSTELSPTLQRRVEKARQAIDALEVQQRETARQSRQAARDLVETGGLSGRPVFSPSTEVLRELVKHLKGNIPVIGVGGIMSANDAQQKINAGASLVQIYTGFIYKGPQLIADCAKQIG